MSERHTISDLLQMQSLSLESKIKMTKYRIREWVDEYGEDGVYICFSGGKDSTVLLDIARKMYPNIRALFVDTGLEFPEIRQFVSTHINVDLVKPSMNFRRVIEKYGYPMISKEVSECVQGARKYLTNLLNENQDLTDRQTDRQTAYKYRFDKLTGEGKYRKFSQSPSDDVIPIRGHKPKYQYEFNKLCGFGKYAKPYEGGTTASIGDLEEYLNLVGWEENPVAIGSGFRSIHKREPESQSEDYP